MGVQFGHWDFRRNTASRHDFERISRMLAPYGPDGDSSYTDSELVMIYHSFHTTEEKPSPAMQPYVSHAGTVYMWDGRLDNRAELAGTLSERVFAETTDVAVVATAHACWGTACFGRFVGDWALSIWNPETRTLHLARDYIGARSLFYQFDRAGIRWGTLLDPLLPEAHGSLPLDAEYLAGWFSSLPAAHLTPFAAIASVPPASFLTVRPSGMEVRTYWEFDPRRQVRYHSDEEYEEHFRHVFAQSVRRRLRSTHPVLAELSGGFDSSAVVCIADRIRTEEADAVPSVDTVSYYNDLESGWNERPFFALVEQQRGKRGLHIDLTSTLAAPLFSDDVSFRAIPDLRFPGHDPRQFSEYLRTTGTRVVLSGIGGDELLGGVPTPLPELADLLVAGRFQALASRINLWALQKKRPWFFLVKDLLCDFLPTALSALPSHRRPPNWLDAKFRSSHKEALCGYSDRTYFFGPAPSFQANLVSVDVLRRQLGAMDLPLSPPFERRFPYLDRDLVEFVFAIPREQFVRPGERRSLMRRALRGVLPDGILRRTSKASVSQTPLRTLAAQSESLMATADHFECVKLGMVDAAGFRQVIQCAKEGRGLQLVPLVRTIQLEHWLRGLIAAGFDLLLEAPPHPHTFRLHPAAGTKTRFSQLGKVHSKGGERDEV